MSVDDLINKALKGSGGVLEVSNLFAVVGDVQTHELFVMNLKEFFSQNMLSLHLKETASAILLAFTDKKSKQANALKHYAKKVITPKV